MNRYAEGVTPTKPRVAAQRLPWVKNEIRTSTPKELRQSGIDEGIVRGHR